MSDETPPPPLRLKARQRPDPETSPGAAPIEVEEGKLRLKPKLSLDPTPNTEESVGALESEPEMEEAPPEEPKIKLKFRMPDPAEPVAEAEAVVEAEPEVQAEVAAETESEEPPSLPPFPVVAPPSDQETEAPSFSESEAPSHSAPPMPRAPVVGGVPPSVYKRPRVPAAILAAERRKRVWKYALVAVGGVFLAAAVIGGVFLKISDPPPAIPLPPRVKYVPPPEPVVVAPVVEKAPLPVEVAPVDPNAGVRVNSTATVELAPGVTATTESIKAVANASVSFRTFVAAAKISGVYQGTPPRAFINGRLVRVGDIVDEMQDITFDSIDVPSRSLVFKDSTGATVSKRY
ncbi:MAG: hypothetical protein ABI222_09535 [Opitutaceae bacterium]